MQKNGIFYHLFSRARQRQAGNERRSRVGHAKTRAVPAKSEGQSAKPRPVPSEKRSAEKKSPVTESDRTLLEATTRFEPVDGFEGRYKTNQKTLFFLSFLIVDSEITIAITIFPLYNREKAVFATPEGIRVPLPGRHDGVITVAHKKPYEFKKTYVLFPLNRGFANAKPCFNSPAYFLTGPSSS